MPSNRETVTEAPKDRWLFSDAGDFVGFAGSEKPGDVPLSRFLWELCGYRRLVECSPAEIAGKILDSPHMHSFSAHTLEQWLNLTRDQDWPQAFCRRSSEQVIQDAGLGWKGCMTLHLQRHPADDAVVRDAMNLVHQLVGKFDVTEGRRLATVGTVTPKHEPDESWFERRGFKKPIASWETLEGPQ